MLWPRVSKKLYKAHFGAHFWNSKSDVKKLLTNPQPLLKANFSMFQMNKNPPKNTHKKFIRRTLSFNEPAILKKSIYPTEL